MLYEAAVSNVADACPPVPPTTDTWPPDLLVAIVWPARSSMLPPVPVRPLPTLMPMAPALPAVDAPVPMAMYPELPSVVVPELNVSSPLTPDSPAFTLFTVTEPLDVFSPYPPIITI